MSHDLWLCFSSSHSLSFWDYDKMEDMHSVTVEPYQTPAASHAHLQSIDQQLNSNLWLVRLHLWFWISWLINYKHTFFPLCISYMLSFIFFSLVNYLGIAFISYVLEGTSNGDEWQAHTNVGKSVMLTWLMKKVVFLSPDCNVGGEVSTNTPTKREAVSLTCKIQVVICLWCSWTTCLKWFPRALY